MRLRGKKLQQNINIVLLSELILFFIDFQIMTDFTMPVRYNHSPNRVNRIAKGDEKPTVQFTMGLGTPASPSLYEGVPLS